SGASAITLTSAPKRARTDGATRLAAPLAQSSTQRRPSRRRPSRAATRWSLYWPIPAGSGSMRPTEAPTTVLTSGDESDDSGAVHPCAGQPGRQRGLEQGARQPRVPTDDELPSRNDAGRGPSEGEDELRGEVDVGDAAEPVGAELQAQAGLPLRVLGRLAGL